ncbi:NIF family HAD-type phosphatase [Sphingobacterium sp. R2]|uniref:NIF family HAD-type phosphatase n=1 Tax=Sphingobacterium sp. R2 TaxID=3112958 RepID=UPI00345CA784
MKETLLVLDLDETLLYATKDKLQQREDFVVGPYYVYVRPNLAYFLSELVGDFKLAIWSSADDTYVHELVDKIKPDAVDFEFIWGRSRTTKKRISVTDEYYYVKRLSKVKRKGFSLERTLIIDDTAEKSMLNYGNAIQIAEFTGNANDDELLLLASYLKQLKNVRNVRQIEKRYWRNQDLPT